VIADDERNELFSINYQSTAASHLGIQEMNREGTVQLILMPYFPYRLVFLTTLSP
jgi:hypothetical protein